MLNAEKYKKEILEITEKGHYFAVSKDRQNIVGRCDGIECKNCIFDDDECGYNLSRMKWLLSEYKEPIKLTRLEYDILKYLSENTTCTYITRDGTGWIYLYDEKPKKSVNWWEGEGVNDFIMFNKLFQFVQWEDEEPTSIKQVLKNCEVADDDERREL